MLTVGKTEVQRHRTILSTDIGEWMHRDTASHEYKLNFRFNLIEILWCAREIASVPLSAEQKRDTENVFHMLLMMFSSTCLHKTLSR